jgi:hypothetical protein
MADEAIASVILLQQPKKAKTGAERARAYRQRKKDQLHFASQPTGAKCHIGKAQNE